MKKTQDKITKGLNKRMGKIQSSILVRSLVGGMMSVVFPITMAGSVVSLLNSIPIDFYQNILETTKLSQLFSAIYTITTNFVALFTLFGVASVYGKLKKEDGSVVGIISIVAYLILVPLIETVGDYGQITYNLGFTWLGSAGMFAAIIVAFLSASLYVKIKNKGWTIKMPESVPQIVSDGFNAIIPGTTVLLIFALLKILLQFTPFGYFNAMIYGLLQLPLNALGTNIVAMLVVCFLVQLLWFFGVHGGMTVIPLVAVVWGIADNQNLIAFNSNQQMMNIVGTSFFNFAYFAGTGLGLALCMVAFSKSEKYKKLGKIGIIPASFGITEPIIYGTPLVMNTKMVIPLFLSPLVSLLITYFATLTNLVPKMAGISTPSGTPIIVRGLLQGSWKLGVLQAVLVLVWVAIWYPFFRKIDNEAYLEEINNAKLQKESL